MKKSHFYCLILTTVHFLNVKNECARVHRFNSHCPPAINFGAQRQLLWQVWLGEQSKNSQSIEKEEKKKKVQSYS